jgi:protein tyrosine/serine phosphatase
VYVHCVGGIGRTGTVVGCWLIRHGMQPEQAFRHLAQLYKTSGQSLYNPHSPETEEQARFILDWKENGLA